MNFSVYVVLPAYNEEAALRQLIPDIGAVLKPSQDYKILVVDDASTDQTPQVLASLAQTWPVSSVRHPENQGYGGAIRTGIVTVLEQARPQDLIVTMDADNTHPPRYILDLIQTLEQGFDVVTTSYTGAGGRASGVPWKRRIFSWGANLLFRWGCPASGARTYTNGFRGYRVGILQRLDRQWGDHLITEKGFPGGAELFLRVCRAGGRIAEIPFELHYENRGKLSRIRIGPTIGAYVRLLARFARFSPWREG